MNAGQTRLRWALAGALLSALGGTAHADFDPWARVKAPQRFKAEALADSLDRDRVSIDPYLQGALAQQKLNQRCAVRLQLVGLDQTQIERSAFLLAECLSQAPGQYQAAALDAWRNALARWPGSPLAAHGWGALAMAALQLDDAEAASVGLDNALRAEVDEEVRARLFTARGQIALSQGELPRASSDFWAAMHEAREIETYTLAQWGLAVALDRARDFPQATGPAVAASHARFGNAGRTSVLDLESTLLFPAEDEHYYRALGLMAEAAAAKGKPTYTSFLQSAQLMWLQYLDAAADSSPGLVRAREHLAAIRREIGDDD